MRHLGIDYGSKKVGLALSDEGGTMGFPHAIVPNTPALLDEVARLIAEKDVRVVVLGESRDFAGEPNPIAHDARAFGDAVQARTGVPVVYESEVLTSEEARQAPSKQMKSRSPKQHRAVDDSAAALILTSYLSHANHG